MRKREKVIRDRSGERSTYKERDGEKENNKERDININKEREKTKRQISEMERKPTGTVRYYQRDGEKNMHSQRQR